jgi:hypothetical protein
MKNSLKRIQNKLNKVPQEAYKEFVKNTPIKTGNARRNTKLKGKTIEANYQYAQVLDKGRHMTNRGMRGSDQAPEGMSKPTQEFIQKRITKILKDK